MAKAVLISIGGSQNPIIYSLNEQKPEYIIFFASPQSQEQIPQILRQINFTPKAFEQIITPLAEDLNESYKAIKKNLTDIVERRKLNPEDIVVDFTGGTKVMSVALTLATIDFGFKYAYVGGTERNKEGLGIVIDGKERILYSTNPWDELAIKERKRISILFNYARYTSAIDLLKAVYSRVSEDKRPFYGIMIDIITAYENWDRFRHFEAKKYLFKGIKDFKTFLAGSDDEKLKQLLTKIEENLQFLLRITDKRECYALICDLIANAERRSKLECKYDDALARLYRTAEMIAQNKLFGKHKIKTNDVDLSKVPETIRSEYNVKYRDRKDNKIKISLRASYKLLKELGDELGEKFFNDKRLIALLDIRNNTILAHGINPVKENDYNDLLDHIIELGEINREDLPEFPSLDF